MIGFLIDTNVLVEGIKGNERELLELVNENLDNYNFCISTNVLEEVSYILLREFSGSSYWKLKKDKSLVKRVFSEKVSLIWKYLLFNFRILSVDEEVLKLGKAYIENFGLLPNDALVLATCKRYKVKYLISIDSDFSEPCKKEGILLINSADRLKEVLNYLRLKQGN